MSCVVAQFWDNNVPYAEYTKKINSAYCEKHNYTHYVDERSDVITSKLNGRSPTWYKPLLVYDAIVKYDPEYVLMLDADAVIVNHDYKIEGFGKPDKQIVCTKDYGPSLMNAGVILFKNSDWTKTFLKKWWSIGDTHENGTYRTGLWHDQTCFSWLLSTFPEIQSNVSIENPDVLNHNEFQNSRCDNFIFHAFAYGSIPKRTIDAAYYKLFDLPFPEGDRLIDIVEMYGTDKHYEHDFFKVAYDDLFFNIRKDVKKFVEIGSHDSTSLKLWKDYFSECKVMSVCPEEPPEVVLKSGNNIDYVVCNTDDTQQIEDLQSIIQGADVILDDGNHRMRDQQQMFARSFQSLKPGGYYIIEDLHTSIELKDNPKHFMNWGDANKTLTLDMLQQFNKDGIRSDYMTDQQEQYLNQTIEYVKIYNTKPNWSYTCVIKKSDNSPVTSANTNQQMNKQTHPINVNDDDDHSNQSNTYLYHTTKDLPDNIKEQIRELGLSGPVVLQHEGNNLTSNHPRVTEEPQQEQTLSAFDDIVYGDGLFDQDLKQHSRAMETLDNEQDQSQVDFVEGVTKDRKNCPTCVIYHCYCVNDWKQIAHEQLTRMKDSGLYDFADEIHTTVNYIDTPVDDVNNFFAEFPKIKVHIYGNNSYERPALNLAQELALSSDMNFCYFHTKGVGNKWTDCRTRKPKVVNETKVTSVKSWRDMMEHYVIDRWEDCIDKLNTHDNVGPGCINGWYWGNFWWSQSHHLRDKNRMFGGDRWECENWLNHGSKDVKNFSFIDIEWAPFHTRVPKWWYDGSQSPYAGEQIVVKKALFGRGPFTIDEGSMWEDWSDDENIDVTDHMINNVRKFEGTRMKLHVTHPHLGKDPAVGCWKLLIVWFHPKSNPNDVYHIGIPEGDNLDFSF